MNDVRFQAGKPVVRDKDKNEPAKVGGLLSDVLPPYNPLMAKMLLKMMGDGKSMDKSCKELAVSPSTFYYWMDIEDGFKQAVEILKKGMARIAHDGFHESAVMELASADFSENEMPIMSERVSAIDKTQKILDRMGKVYDPATYSKDREKTGAAGLNIQINFGESANLEDYQPKLVDGKFEHEVLNVEKE